MTKPTMPTPDTTVYGKDRFTAPKHAYFHENVLALNKAWATYHEAAIKAAVAAEREKSATEFEEFARAIAHQCRGRIGDLVVQRALEWAAEIRARGAVHD